jgi:hypothetical protein
MSFTNWRTASRAQIADRGAVLVLLALSMVLLLSAAALAVDFAAARNDRTGAKRASDAAAAAGALTFLDAGAEEACLDTVEYLALNGVEVTPTAPIDCTGFPTSCASGTTPSVSATMSDPKLTVTITYPVQDAAQMMDPSALGTTVQTVLAEDGEACNRFGVSITSTHQTFFAGVLGADEVSSTVHSVSLMIPSTADGRALNLLLLERHDCDVLSANGGGSGGGIFVGAMTDPVTGEVHRGTTVLDSDGSGSGCGSSGTIDVVGSASVVRADGAPGCAGELTPGTGEGCGILELFAPGTPGCNLPACDSSGTVAPNPTASGTRLTRAPVDHKFNCKSSYPLALDIAGCRGATSSGAYIDNLVAAVGPIGKPTPAWDWQNYSPTYPCTVGGAPGTIVTVPQGNWRVNCDLDIRQTLIFSGGNIVFDGDVRIGSSGVLDINSSNSNSVYWPPDTVLDTSESSATAAFIFFRDGTLTKGGQGSLILTNVMTYLSETSTVDMGGGSGAVRMLAPTEGPFKNLGMWSESTRDHNFAGQAALALEGVFFIPHATVNYQGNGAQIQVAAQFISRKLRVAGNGALTVTPRFDRLVSFPLNSAIVLIR